MKAKLTEEEFVNWWLEKYHNTNLDGVMEAHPEWSDNPPAHSRDFFDAYKVTNEQYNEWAEWVKLQLKEIYKCSRQEAKDAFLWIGLMIAPIVKDL